MATPNVWRRLKSARWVGVCLSLWALASSSGVCREWRLRVVGDLSFGRDWTPILRREGLDYPVRALGTYLSEAELTLGFLDGSLSDGGEPQPGATEPMRSAPDVAPALAAAGFDGLCIASPHIMDFGGEGFGDTQRHLETRGVAVFGAGLNDTLSRLSAVLTVGDLTVSCLGYLHGIHRAQAGQETPGANPALASALRDDIANAKRTTNVVLVFIHWGEGRGDDVDGKQRLIAEMAIDAGADAVFGLRRGTWQGAQSYAGKPICYSLGDFIRGTRSLRYGRILIPTVVFEDAVPLRVEWTPVRIDDALKPGDDPALRLQPRLLSADEAREPIEMFTDFCKTLGTSLVARTVDDRVVLDMPLASEPAR
ncbi:CapA family protein [Candidatus Poribacteria bacterium]|nr:CapA family protein [Candidatus Poribacteria bacterium]